MNSTESWITLGVGLAMAMGVVGALLPGFPDLILIWGAALAYGILAGWGSAGPWLFGLITVLTLGGLAADFWVGGIAARLGGASFVGILGGLAMALPGFLFLGPFGALLGLLLGTFLVEYLRRRDVTHASRATAGMGIGYGLAFVVKIGLCLAMVAAWLVWVVAR